jgi:hypothetical protein
MTKIMHCPECAQEYETERPGEKCDNCGNFLQMGNRNNLTVDGRNLVQIIADYQIGANKILSQLRGWKIGAREAHRLESAARNMFYEDMNNIGISCREAMKTWQNKIIDEILAQDPAFMED